LSDLKGRTLTGWEDIKQALIVVDRISEEERNGVRVEVYEHSKESSVKVSFRSLKELDEWLEMRFRNQLLKGDINPSSKILDVFGEVYGNALTRSRL
jgi:hypothetical protein